MLWNDLEVGDGGEGRLETEGYMYTLRLSPAQLLPHFLEMEKGSEQETA